MHSPENFLRKLPLRKAVSGEFPKSVHLIRKFQKLSGRKIRWNGKFPVIQCIPQEVVLFSGYCANCCSTGHCGNCRKLKPELSTKRAPYVPEVFWSDLVIRKKYTTYSAPQVSRIFHHFLLSCLLYKYTV